MDIFEAILEDHEVQRELIDKLMDTKGDSQERKKIFKRLRSNLETHAEAEERHFYKPLISKDSTQDQARHSIAEHEDIDDLLDKLEATEMDSPAWMDTAKKLKHEVIHHLDEEEEDVFPMADGVLEDKKLEDLALKYRAYMNENS